MYLFFDTETTGLPRNWKAPVDDLNNWPRLVQIAWLQFDMDGNEIGGESFIIKPEGFIIPDDVSKIHGISNEKAIDEGKELHLILNVFYDLILRSSYLVAHNMSFDEKIVGAEFIRKNIPNRIPEKTRICTMDKATNYCKIEGPYGYRWPKLSELHYKLFGTGFDEAHNAAVDIKATAKCFWEMKNLGLI